MREFQKQGGMEKMKKVTKDDTKEGLKIVKEIFFYDIPQTLKKNLRDIKDAAQRRLK